MDGWKEFCIDIINKNEDLSSIKKDNGTYLEKYNVYPDSINKTQGSYFFLARNSTEKFLVVTGEAGAKYSFIGEIINISGFKVLKCPMSNENCLIIQKIFKFTNSSHNKNNEISVGFGDRLGVASPGHIRLVKDLPVYPVLAQQSIRELNLTGRTFADVICAASWAVFQEGYTKGFGFDGDHLKTSDEVKMALENKCTMITLDCSEYIHDGVQGASVTAVSKTYMEIDQKERTRLESTYLGKTFVLPNGTEIKFSSGIFYKIVLTYIDAIQFTEQIFNDYIIKNSEPVDFELSIDETSTPTLPEAHFFVAQELAFHNVIIASLAPRFCGEFQKGIDYRGDLDQFEKEYVIHEKIANRFGYKISIHSGSDKFSVFPCIGANSKKYHLKTAGTNWLEAIRLISKKNPGLYREIHNFALEHFNEATKYYHVTTNISKVPDISKYSDAQLPSLLSLDDTRQMLHITYGLILQAKNPDGSTKFHSRIYKTLFIYEDDFYRLLEEHLGEHLRKLGLLSEKTAKS